MKVYVASHDQEEGRRVAALIRARGHQVTSRWLDWSFERTAAYTEATRRNIAHIDVNDVLDADVLVLIAGPEKYAGGKFVEAGVALGLGKQVIVIGRRENMLLWHPLVRQVETPEQAVELLQ